MLTAARIVLGLSAVMFAAIGLAGLFAPDALLDSFDLRPVSPKGTAEIRGLYGGGFLAWSAMLVLAWRMPGLRVGLFGAVGLSMGAIAAARFVSLLVEGEPAFNLPALIAEALIALACFALARRPARPPGLL